MTEQALTPTQVVSRLAELSRKLDAAQRDLARDDEAAVRSRARYEVAFARAFLTGEGSVDARKQQAVITVETVKLDAEIADARVRNGRTLITVLRTQVEVGRSLGAGLRSEWAATP